MIKLLSLLLVINFSEAKISSISEIEINLNKPTTIYMTTQGPTVIDVPCDVSFSIIGLHEDIVTTIGPNNKRTFTLWLKNDESQPSSFNLKCGSEMFVFYVVPNKYNHQSYIKALDYYEEEEAIVTKEKKTEEINKKRLIFDSNNKSLEAEEFEEMKKKLVTKEIIK